MNKHLHNSLRALFLSLAVLLSLPMLAVKVEIDGINYELNADAKQATVRAKSSGEYSGSIVIPESVEHEGAAYSVESIGDDAFRYCSGLTSVTIGNSVTSIGDYAFSGCSGLTSVTIGNSVTSIGELAFSGCSGLTSVSIPNSVTSIGSAAFQSCSGLTSVTIGNSVESIGDAAFFDCSGLTSVTIGNSVTSIGGNAFYACSALTSLTIPNSVTSIGYAAFSDCSVLTSVTIPNSVTSIGGDAFYGCSGLTSVTIGNSVTSIGRCAFRDCPDLLDVYCYAEKVPFTYTDAFYGSCPENATLHVPDASINSYKATEPWSGFGKIVALLNYEFDAETKQATVIAKSSGTYSGEVVIPESVEHEGAAYSVTSIGNGAFRDCSGLTSVTIPNSVTSIGERAFEECTGLTSVHISDIAAWCNIDFGTSLSNPLCYAHHLYLNGEEVKDLVIPNSVTSIGNYAFDNCSGLTSVTIPNSVTRIGDVAFWGCSGLTSVTIPNSVTSIGQEAFRGCSGLTSVTIPNSVTSIGDQAFRGCSGLTSVHISDIAAWCNIDFVDSYSNPLHCAHHLYLNGEEVKDLVIPNSMTSIGDYAFRGCSGLTSVTIPNSVTSIGNYAFDNCSGLTSVTIPNSVTRIGDVAFWGCSGLTSVTIPNSVTSIGQEAFEGCSGLTSVTIGNSVTSIGSEAFANCTELHDLYCYAENVPSTGSNAFSSSLIANATLYVPAASINSYNATAPWSGFGKIVALLNYEFDAETKQATVIAKSSGKYSGEVVIPESVEHEGVAYSVTSIGQSAFYGCSGLTSVTIPNSVTSIGGWTFAGCTRLTSVTIPNSVTIIGERAFQACSGLTSVTIGNSVRIIRSGAFQHCKGLTSVTIPNGVTSIGNNTFEGCSGLTSVTIPNSVKSIGQSAFSGCSGLTSIVVEDGNTVYDSRNNCNAIIETATNTLHSGCKTTIIPNSVTSIGNYAFSGCSGLISVTIPNSVTSIGQSAFNGCSGLTSVTIPNSVTSIGKEAFYGCSGLTSVTIPNSVESIGDWAFGYCSKLLNVYCYAENVPSTGSNAFYGSHPENATLHVPAASINSYEATAPWSSFGTITSDLTLTDDEEFENNTEQTFSTLTYTRTLPNMLWNPLYVPFKIPYEDLEENYEVAYINAMHSYDNDDNGEIDDMVMEIVKVKAGTLKPNHPYLIKAKNEEAKEMSIVQENATLYPAEITTLDCSSVYTKFEITGTYQKMTSGELNGSLVISTDGAWKKLSATSTLKPFRFYLTISSREGSPVEIAEDAMSRVRIRVMGEDDNATGIDEVKTANDEQKSEIYDLSGRRVSAPAKGGVYIIKGKKVIY